MGYKTAISPYKWEGEADLKYLYGNKYIGGYGIRSNIKAYEWMEETYDILSPSTTVYQFPTSTTTITISKSALTLYQYELELNESKRSIKVIKKEFAETVNAQFETLMSE